MLIGERFATLTRQIGGDQEGTPQQGLKRLSNFEIGGEGLVEKRASYNGIGFPQRFLRQYSLGHRQAADAIEPRSPHVMRRDPCFSIKLFSGWSILLFDGLFTTPARASESSPVITIGVDCELAFTARSCSENS